jgi:glutaredoxin 3
LIDIYTRDNCIWCEKAKEFMKNNDIPFKEFQIGKNVSRSWVMEAFPYQRTVPIIIDGQRSIGGYDDLIREYATNENLGKTLLQG